MVDTPAPATPNAAPPAPAPAAAPPTAAPATPPAAPASSPDGLLAAAVANKPAAPAADPATPAPAAAAVERPADVPEQFWDAAKGAIRTDALTKAWKDSREHIKQLSADRTVPESHDKYAFNKPESLKREIPGDDPALGLFRKAAHAAGLSQTQFDKLAGNFLMGVDAMVPPALDLAAEKAKLGSNADAVINQVVAWGDKMIKDGVWSKDEYDEIIVMGSTALGLSALHKAAVRYGEKPIPLTGATIEGLPSKEELYAMKGTDKYRADPAERARVEGLFEKVFGTDPAGTSEPGLGVGSPVRRSA